MKPLSCIIQRSYAQSPVFEIVHDESVKVYLHMYNEKGQQISLCVESCVTKGRFRPSVVAHVKYIHVFYRLHSDYRSILSVYETASTEFLL